MYKRQELLYPQIIETALAYKIVMVGPQTIDELNIPVSYTHLDVYKRQVSGITR